MKPGAVLQARKPAIGALAQRTVHRPSVRLCLAGTEWPIPLSLGDDERRRFPFPRRQPCTVNSLAASHLITWQQVQSNKSSRENVTQWGLLVSRDSIFFLIPASGCQEKAGGGFAVHGPDRDSVLHTGTRRPSTSSSR